jgi:adenosylcobinamide kinase/adenosylcobinamide-phosphate guanylyltransferase
MTSFGQSLLILGGARSGKSRRGQILAEGVSGELVYVATAQAFDTEMTRRIAQHRADRGDRWRTVEAPLDLPDAIAREGREGAVVLVDCLTLWLTNLMLGEHDLPAAAADLLDAIRASSAPIILVSNEVGFGIVPENPLARRFRDEAGRLNQQVAEVVETVELVVAGLPLRLKG